MAVGTPGIPSAAERAAKSYLISPDVAAFQGGERSRSQRAPSKLDHMSTGFWSRPKPPKHTMWKAATTQAWPGRGDHPAAGVTSSQVTPSRVRHTSLK